MARKLCLICAAFFLGIVLSDFGLYLSVILGSALFMYLMIRRKHYVFLPVLLAVFISGSFYLNAYNSLNSAKVAPFIGKETIFLGRIVSCPEKLSDGQRFYVETSGFKIRLTTASTELSYGDIIEFTANLETPTSPGNDVAFDYAVYLKGRGVFAKAYSNNVVYRSSDVRLYRPTDLANVIRQSLLFRIDESFQGDTRMLLRAVLLGDRSQMSDSLSQILSESGISHIAAVSGLHVSIIMALLCRVVAPLFGRKSRFSALLFLPIIFLFVLVTGMSPSTVRAGIMLTLYVIGNVLFFDYDGLTSLSAAGLILLIFNPFYAFDASFLLSFSATAGILIFYDRLIERIKFVRPIFLRTTLCTTICAQVFTLPFSAYFFRHVAVLGVVTNLVAVPLLPIIMTLGFITVFVPFISPYAASACDVLCRLVLSFAEFIAKLPCAIFNIRKEQVVFLLIIYSCLLAAFILLFKTKYRKPILTLLHTACAALALMLIVTAIPSFGTSISFINIGHGDCTLIQNRNTAVMIDCGVSDPTESYDPVFDTVLPYMSYHGSDMLDALFVSHYSSGYTDGSLSLVAAGKVKTLFLPYEDTHNYYYNELLGAAINSKTTVYMLDKPKIRINIGEMTFDVVSDTGVDAAHNVVLKLSYKDKSALFCGNMTPDEEDTLAKCDADLSCDILKIPSHGADDAAGEKLLSKVLPSHSIIFSDYRGFPDMHTVHRIQSFGSDVWTTKSNGTVRFKLSEDGKIFVNPYRGNFS